MKKLLFIVNPMAGKNRDKRALEDRIRSLDLDSEIVCTTHPGHARELAAAAGCTVEAPWPEAKRRILAAVAQVVPDCVL